MLPKPCTSSFWRSADLGVTTLILFTVASCSNGKREPVATPEEASETPTAAAAPEPKDRIEGPAGTLYINDGGWGGTPVVFVHSMGGNSSFWDAQLQHLRQNRRAVAIDFRGHGQSDSAANGDYSVEGFANDIAAVVDSLGLKRFVLVGHSLGGAAAVTYAGAHPDKVAGLVLVGTPGKSTPEMADSVMALLESEDYQRVMDEYTARLLTNAAPNVATRVKAGLTAIPKQRTIVIARSIFDYDPTTALQAYPGPTMEISIAGLPDDPNSLHRLEPAIVYKEMTGVSHWMFMDQPDQFNLLLDGFLVTVK